MQIKTVYAFDDEGFYNGERDAMTDPMNPNVWLMPPSSTDVAPKVDEAHFAKWNGKEWEAVAKPASAEDFVGLAVSHKTDTAHRIEMRELMKKFCDGNQDFITTLDDKHEFWTIAKKPDPTAEELEAQALEQAKSERASAVSKIVVEVDGMLFDGDETAQTRMGRTVAGAVALGLDIETEKRTWVLADNTVAEVTVKQLVEALRKAGDVQTELWTVPYQDGE